MISSSIDYKLEKDKRKYFYKIIVIDAHEHENEGGLYRFKVELIGNVGDTNSKTLFLKTNSPNALRKRW